MMSLIFWLIGILGIGGTVALFIFAPALATTLLQGAISILSAMLKTRVGVGILVGVAALIAGELHGKFTAEQACHEADVKAQNAVLARDLAIKTAAADDAANRADEIETAAKLNEERVHALETALAAKPAASVCRAANDDVRKLRNIR